MTKEISIGCTVLDITSGIKGLAISRLTFLTGNVQYSVQVKSKEDGVYVEPMGFDVHQLDYVDDGVSSRAIAGPADTGIALGSEVQDIVSGFKGLAIRKVEFMNGCVYYIVQAKKDKENTSKEDFIEFRRLKLVGQGVISEIEKRIAESEKINPSFAGRPAGGPATRPMARR